MRSYATHNNAIVLNATGSKKESNDSNSVNIYGRVFINGRPLDKIISDMIDEKLNGKGL